MDKEDLTQKALKYAALSDTTHLVRALLAEEPALTGAEVLARMDEWVKEAYVEVQAFRPA
ncbi:hypothetical protein [Streptomyces sp. 147326]|uniref:hypothetical protein n=1 Tax=Streptomyces sp. 147326 TaxID=3074379 RepID=UPI00385751DF